MKKFNDGKCYVMIKRIIKKGLIVYFIYLIVSVMIIYKLPIFIGSDLEYDASEMLTVSNKNSYAYLVEDTDEAMDIRLALIEEAKATISIAYYKYLDDRAGAIFTGALLKQANAGIKINIVIDGKSVAKRNVYKVLASHENITFSGYEPINLLLPYRANNSLHDKMLVIDEKYGLIGGRNIDERFLFSDNKTVTLDRDVLVYSTNDSSEAGSEMKAYIDELSASKYVKQYKITSKEKYAKYGIDMIAKYNEHRSNGYNLEDKLSNAVAVDRVSFVRSPLTRFTKEPVLFDVVTQLMATSNDIVIQSPYITQSYLLKRHFSMSKDKNITLLTNNMSTNPNIPSLSGYVRIRQQLAKDYKLYELQNENSIHAKTITIGDDISIIGSQNMDHRSMFLSTESSVVIYSKEFQDVLNKELDKLFDESLLVNADGTYEVSVTVEPVKSKSFKKVLIKILSWISYFFNEMLTKTI